MSLETRIRSGSLHPAFLTRELRRRDLGYAGFMACGSILAIAAVLRWLPTDTWLYLALATVFRLPVLSVFVVGGLVGAAFAVSAWREWPLPLLTVLTAGTVSVPWLARRWPGAAEVSADLYLALYTLVALMLPLRWYLVDRRRLRRRHPPVVDENWL